MERLALVAALLGSGQAATVQLGLRGAISQTEDNFICVNMDWWPVRKQKPRRFLCANLALPFHLRGSDLPSSLA